MEGTQQDRCRCGDRRGRLVGGIDLGSGPPTTDPLIPFWNATVRFGFFSCSRSSFDRLPAAVERQTSLALTAP